MRHHSLLEGESAKQGRSPQASRWGELIAYEPLPTPGLPRQRGAQRQVVRRVAAREPAAAALQAEVERLGQRQAGAEVPALIVAFRQRHPRIRRQHPAAAQGRQAPAELGAEASGCDHSVATALPAAPQDGSSASDGPRPEAFGDKRIDPLAPHSS